MISFKQYYLSEVSGYTSRATGKNILAIGTPLGRNPGGFLGDASTNREPTGDTIVINKTKLEDEEKESSKKKNKKKNKKKSVKPKKLDAQSIDDNPMDNKPMLNWVGV